MSSPALLPGVEAGLPPASDRMLTTCFLAAVFHAIVILGVTFSSANRDAAGPDGPALEVVLVNEQAPRAAANPHARYVAQRNQAGAGNARDGRTQIPRSSAAPLDQLGMPDGAGMAAQQAEGDWAIAGRHVSKPLAASMVAPAGALRKLQVSVRGGA